MVVLPATIAGCGNFDLNADPLVPFEYPNFCNSGPNGLNDRLFAGGGVLVNDSSGTTYEVTGVEFIDSKNVAMLESVLVPGVEPWGTANSVIPNLKAKWLQQMDGVPVPWPWQQRTDAVGAQLRPGDTGEIVVQFLQIKPGPWSFKGIRTTYSNGWRTFRHDQPLLGTNDESLCR